MPKHLIPVSTPINNMYKRQIFKDEYCSELARMARQQLALINKCQMHKRGGRGIARSASPLGSSKNQPFYVQFLNR